jgi:raffinose/stachyose/melibiose transport system substrate-binding protein
MRKTYRFPVLVTIFTLLTLLSLSLGVSAQDPVTIRWWHINTGDPGLSNWQALADEFMAANPHVTIEITVLENEAFKARLVTVMQAGDPPDLFQSWGGGVLRTFAENGLVRNIAPELEGEWKDSIAAQSALELYGQNGEYYGVPWTWGAVGFFYNKTLFEQAGLDPEAPPATWDEFLAAVQTLKDAGITPISLGEGDKWPGQFWWIYLAIREGGQEAFEKAYSREGSFADEPFVRAGQRLEELVALEPFPEGFLAMTYGDQETVFGNGEAAMELMGQWSPDVQRSNSESGEGIGDALGWFNFPLVDGGAGGPDDVLGGGDGFAVGANAPDETIEFLRFITTEEVQRSMYEQGLVLPVVTNVDDLFEDNPISKAILDARNGAPYFQLYYDQFLPPAMGTVVLDSVESIFAGTGTAEEAAQALEDSASFELE